MSPIGPEADVDCEIRTGTTIRAGPVAVLLGQLGPPAPMALSTRYATQEYRKTMDIEPPSVSKTAFPALASRIEALTASVRSGLAFADNPYDQERLERMLRLCAESVALLNSGCELDSELAERLHDEWVNRLEKHDFGYVTPKVSVGAIVFNGNDELLLVKNERSGLWSFPVGFAEVGQSPSEVARMEVEEEANVIAEVVELMGVGDSFKRGFNPSLHVYNLLFYCRLVSGRPRPRTSETTKAAFFGHSNMPSPLLLDGLPWVADAFRWHSNENRTPFFD